MRSIPSSSSASTSAIAPGTASSQRIATAVPQIRDKKSVPSDRPTLFNQRYHIVKSLGRGGFGITALAQDYALPGKPYCVIKKLSPLIQDPEAFSRASQRFRQEAKTLARLGGHAQVPLLLNFFGGQDTNGKGAFFLIQEFVQGANLAQLVKAHGVWSEAQVLQFWQDMLPVIDFIHSKGVIHRDIKPSNIMRSSFDQRLVLLDFGAVKSVFAQEETCLQLTQKFVGTGGFAPPEQQQLRPCFASDFYALGMTSLFLLSGRWPQAFPWDKSHQRIQWQDQLEVSPPLAEFLNQLLDPNPYNRFGKVQDAQRFLDKVAKHLRISQAVQTARSAESAQAQAAPRHDDLQACLHHHAPQRRLRKGSSLSSERFTS